MFFITIELGLLNVYHHDYLINQINIRLKANGTYNVDVTFHWNESDFFDSIFPYKDMVSFLELAQNNITF